MKSERAKTKQLFIDELETLLSKPCAKTNSSGGLRAREGEK